MLECICLAENKYFRKFNHRFFHRLTNLFQSTHQDNLISWGGGFFSTTCPPSLIKAVPCRDLVPLPTLSIYTLLSRAPRSLQRVCDSLLEMQPKVFVVLHGLMIEASLVGLNADVKPYDPPKWAPSGPTLQLVLPITYHKMHKICLWTMLGKTRVRDE